MLLIRPALKPIAPELLKLLLILKVDFLLLLRLHVILRDALLVDCKIRVFIFKDSNILLGFTELPRIYWFGKMLFVLI